jgi:hypothetical protein
MTIDATRFDATRFDATRFDATRFDGGDDLGLKLPRITERPC